MKKKGYAVLLILSIVFAIAAVKTTIPNADAGKDCLLGYRAHCSFTPVSTVICLALAAACCIVRRRSFTTEG
ncbi:MAG: hypothetical protein A2Y64_02535 [Candidatus Coatesbacteria bacterium RBG_13_66_14]|uniref:DUF4418 domain-containing protein n=1 Tax=Candidatus Coatesbacteria bacterium RBG_13_66_14 TaxID=1817816 RepID=A0A1F5F736_9BACT|nr:MAG: hypothetical protein A2Y64_02535 [Candidatus Coatesbacteria bacterium RBG_13_66_14]